MADPGAADAAEGATAANKDLWTRINAEYTDEQALRSWAAEDISWGVFNVPEAGLDVVGDVAGLTSWISAAARRTCRPGWRGGGPGPVRPRRFAGIPAGWMMT